MQQDEARPRRVGRRSVLSYGLAGGAMLALAPSILSRAAHAATGGTLTANMKDLPNFDILGNNTSWVILTLGPCYNSLVGIENGDPRRLRGELAERWETSEDGRSVTFHLRDGVLFHDGQPLTSADVKHTFDLARDPPAGTVSTRKNLLVGIEAIETPDPLTVVFRLKRPMPFFLPLMATGWMVVLPKHVLEREGHMQNEVVGTGPYRLDGYQRGVQLSLVRNDDYFDRSEPKLDAITFYVATDPGTLDAYFRTGQIMLYNEMSPDSGTRFEDGKVPGVTVQRVVAPNPTAITINGRSGPWADIRVRQAASLAVNRRESLNVLEHGQGVVGGFLPPGEYALPPERLALMPGYGADYEANLARARELLAEAGHPDGLTARMLVRKNEEHEQRGIFMQGVLSKVGIRLSLDVQESAMFFKSLADSAFDLASQGGLSYAVNDPDIVFGTLHTKGPGNVTGVFNEEMDRLYAEQMALTDEAKRIEIAHHMDEIALTECSRLILFYHDKFVGHSTRLQGYVATGNPDDVSRLAGISLTS